MVELKVRGEGDATERWCGPTLRESEAADEIEPAA
jgi:hypothetical protein